MAKVAAVILLDNARGVEREARAALSKPISRNCGSTSFGTSIP